MVSGIAVEVEPEQAAVQVVDTYDLRLPVPIYVSDGVSLQQLIGTPEDYVPGEVTHAVILEPVKAPAGISSNQV